MNFAALKTELTTDPLARGYAGMGDEAAAVSLNAPNRTPDRETLDSGLLMSCVVRSEYDALSAADKDYFRQVIAAGSVPITSALRQGIGNVFGAATTTRANIIAALKRVGSRAEELGLGSVTTSDVARARAL